MDLQVQRGGRRFTTSAYLERLKRRQLSAIGEKWEDLVPIRLEIDHEGWKLRDTFTWNASDDLTSHDEFSKNLCEDYGLPESSFVPLVREAIQAQISEYLSAKTSSVDGTLTRTNPELRINIKLDITVGAMNLLDQFDWDILDETSSPEDFAAAFAADLGLAGEFKTAIAHSIREQVEVHLRSLALAGHPFDGTEVLDDELKGAFLPGVQRLSVTRVGQEVEDHTPRLLQLTEAEVDRQERDRERDSKRKKRQTRGR
ncbi:SNF5-domain-containing protein, partial [Microstroma glucosiphilum]